MKHLIPLCAAVVLMGAHAPQQPPMTFFITSAGSGDGANLGGIEGADRKCTDLARAAGSPTSIMWRAYLSVAAENGKPAVNAKDRIGRGPWHNAKGVQIAANVAELHSEAAKTGKEGSLTETGATVNGRGDTPNTHDILTGSNLDGTLAAIDSTNNNCGNFRSSAAGAPNSARVGHHDRQGGGQNPTSWNSAHGSRGCSQDNLRGSGGAGLFYCFGMPMEGSRPPAFKQD